MIEFLRVAVIAVGAALLYLLALVVMTFAIGLPLQWFYERRRQNRLRKVRAQNLSASAPRLRGRMTRLLQPTLLLTPAKEPGFSKIGGVPDLPIGVVWPMGTEGPRAFVAQIDFSAFRAHVDMDWLPVEGRIYAFFDDARNGFNDVVQVVYSLDLAGPHGLPPAPISTRWSFKERRVAFMPFTSTPSLDWLDVDRSTLDLDDDEAQALEETEFGDEIQHRIGGYPSEIQGGAMHIECEFLRRGLTQDYSQPVPPAIRSAARQWRMLLQIDTDPALNMNWWDAGRLYVFVRARDAKRGDFSKTVTITQTY